MFPLFDENKSESKPIVTWILIVLNVVVFVYQVTSGSFTRLVTSFGVTPISVLCGERLYTLITSMFLHGSILHLFGNMLYLFIFGDNVEDKLGHLKYLLAYLCFGVSAGLIHSFMAFINGGRDLMIPAIGASGAISGVLGAYFVLFPRARVVCLVFLFYFLRLVSVPAVFFLGFWFIFQFMYASIGFETGVAYWAHVGGFIVGFVVGLTAKFTLLRKRWRRGAYLIYYPFYEA